MPTRPLRNRLPRAQRQLLDAIARSLPSRTRLYLVGGTVRDLLLRRPVEDLDVVVTGLPLARVAALLRTHGTVTERGAAFGVLHVGSHSGGWSLDVALPRTERAGGSGGYRDFSFTPDPTLPMEEDLARRDFTVNAMAYAWMEDELIDPFGGRADLRRKQLVAVGNPRARFQEDFSRLLRLMRLAAELNLSIEPATARAARLLAPGLVRRRSGRFIVPREVVAEQLVRSLVANPVRTAELLRSLGLATALLPTYSPAQWRRAIAALRRVRGGTATVLLAALLSPLGPRVTQRLCASLKLSAAGRGIHCARLVLVVGWTQMEASAVAAIPATSLAAHFGWAQGKEFLSLLATTNPRTARALRARLRTLFRQRGGSFVAPPPLLTGAEVIAATHVRPGPVVGRLLAAVREQQLQGDVRTKRAAQRYLQSLLQRP